MSTMSPNNPIDLKSFESVNVTMDEKQTKEWEKTFKDDQKFNEFLTGSGTELLELFDATALDIKIKDVVDNALDKGRTDKLTNVDKAYLVLKALKDGKVGSYQELLTAEIQRIEIDIKKAKLEKVIDKDKTLSEVEKQVLREQLAEQAANATTVAEFEENYGVASGTIDAIKDVKNVVKMVLHALNPKTQFNIMKDMANIGIKM